ncbi:MAG: histidine kinase, partial [Oscillospiraceae bacterium]|nr:histidine kinase [Oscillospiraceae bacterium]
FTLQQSNISQPDLLRISDPLMEERISALHGNPCWVGIDFAAGTILPDDSADQYIRVSSEVTGVNIDEHLGYLNFFIRSSVFQDVLQSIPYSTGQGIMIVDDQNSILSASSDVPEDLLKQLELNSFARLSDLKIATDKGVYIVSSITEKSSGWHILSFLSEKAAVDSLRAKNASLLFPLLLLPLACLFLTDLFFSRFYRSLSPLLDAMQKISSGNIDERIPIGNDYLIDSISTTMNSMLDQYEHLVSVNAHQEALLITSRLKILRGQISPHYLYNTLDSINWKLIEEGSMEASSTISKLGNVLRYSINESSSTVCLKEELSVIDQYLQICKFRFEDRLHYTISVEDQLEDYQIPRFILQPIVENAVIYGLERALDRALICIHCYSTDRFTIIEISNDGPSISDEEKEVIYRSFQQTQPDTSHIGLKNVYQRIKLFYGDPYSLSISDLSPHGAMIRLSLPPM